MNWRAIGAASFLAAAITLSGASFAQDLRSQQTALEKDIAAFNQQIATKQQQITALRNKPSPEQAELAAAQKAVSDARAEAKATPGPDSDGKARNAEFKLKLAQMKFDKSNGDIDALNEDIDRLKQQIGNKQQQIKDLKTAADQAADNQQQKLADDRKRQEQELARTKQEAKQEAERAQKEIERLKAALATKEAAEAKAAASAPAPVAAPAPPPETAKAEAPKTSAPAPAITDSADGIVKLNSQDQVLHELQALAQRVSVQPRNGDSDSTSLVLYLKRPDAKASNKNKITLRALGSGQYRGVSNVEAGQYEAVIGFNRWPVQLSGSESGDLVFLCDYSNDKKPRLIVYNSSLESGK